MTHSTLVVFTKAQDNAEDDITRLMEPYDENAHWEDWPESGVPWSWDWYVIGGRWDGAMRGLDRLGLSEPCTICFGSGTRPGGLGQFGQAWFDSMKGCNGCHGTGKMQRDGFAFGDEYRTLERNACYPADIEAEFSPFAFMTPDGTVHARQTWNGTTHTDTEGWQQMWTEAKGAFADCLAVSLDVHA